MGDLSITLVQTNLHWEDKTANLRMLEEKINSIKEKTHIVVLPEMFSTGFSMQPEKLAETMDGNSVQWMKRLSAEKKVIITGSLIIEESGSYFNRLLWVLPNGQTGVYDKRHLFAYAGEDQHYSSGTKRFIASVNGWKIFPLICYDLRFPVWSRQQFAENGSFEYDVLLYVANWPDRRVNAWKTLLQARAIENQAYAIGVNRVGKDGNDIHHSGASSVIDGMGEIIFQQEETEVVKTIVLDKNSLATLREKLPFSKDADEFQILV